MFVLHWTSHCWSKLNTEVPLFYFLPFHDPMTPFVCLLFFGRKTDFSRTAPSLHSRVCLSSVTSALRSPLSRFFSLSSTGSGRVTFVQHRIKGHFRLKQLYLRHLCTHKHTDLKEQKEKWILKELVTFQSKKLELLQFIAMHPFYPWY